MPVFGRSRAPLLPTNRRPTRRCLSGIPFVQVVSNSWVSPSQNEPSRKSLRESICPSRADSQNNRLIGWRIVRKLHSCCLKDTPIENGEFNEVARFEFYEWR